LGYNSKIAAVLGNGPSRKFYDPSKAYAYRLGCNIPWTDVDATLISDDNIVVLWHKNHDLIKVPTYFSRKTWMFTDELKTFRPFIKQFKLFAGVFDRQPNESSGNAAAKKLIELGYKELDIYGCDAYFTATHGYNIKSYTREFIPGIDMINNSYKWKLFWDELIKKHPEVKFNFIKE
jgi:hypothetical protein